MSEAKGESAQSGLRPQSSVLDLFCKTLATGLFLSYIPAALMPGRSYTGAGLLGAVLGWVLIRWMPEAPLLYTLILALSTLMAVGISDTAGHAFPIKDDPRIIIDETVGFWVSAAFLPRDFMPMLAAFILFRIFDVWKPWPVNRMEALPGGWGVVLDDSMAGLMACAAVHAGRFLLPFLRHLL
jgi:phosphatidylglycerophosphatase A